MGTAGIPLSPPVSRECEYECCGNTAGMDLTTAGFPQGWILLRREPRTEPFSTVKPRIEAPGFYLYKRP